MRHEFFALTLRSNGLNDKYHWISFRLTLYFSFHRSQFVSQCSWKLLESTEWKIKLIKQNPAIFIIEPILSTTLFFLATINSLLVNPIDFCLASNAVQPDDIFSTIFTARLMRWNPKNINSLKTELIFATPNVIMKVFVEQAMILCIFLSCARNFGLAHTVLWLLWSSIHHCSDSSYPLLRRPIACAIYWLYFRRLNSIPLD